MYQGIKRVFEDFVKPADSPEQKMVGARAFVAELRKRLGLYEDEYGTPRLNESQATMSSRSFCIKGLAESLIGPDWADQIRQSNASAFRVFEAGGVGAITPANLPNVSAYLGSVIGLLDAQILKGYSMPEFIADQLVPTRPSKTRVSRYIGAGWMGDVALNRNPGEPYPEAQIEERFVTTQETQQYALKGSVTFEAIFFEQTQQVLDQMNMIGKWLGLKRERSAFRLIAGVTNPYSYRGTSYNTWLTSGNWINHLTGVLLRDWTSINVVNSYFSRMKDQETGTRIAVDWDTVLCSPSKTMTAQYIQAATEVESVTQSGQVVSHAKRLGDSKKILSSTFLDEILTNATTDPVNPGLALAQSVADDYWWALRTAGDDPAFIRTENWPITIQRASPNDYAMLNQKLVLAVFADYMDSVDVREPRYGIMCTPS
jgi:hypothetical protein